ncbi:MAG: calcium-binding protein [Candidatus Micrarchaeota archaeon]
METAIVDAYSEDEQFTGWCCVLEENITVPQECRIKRKPATLIKIVEADSGHAIHGEVCLDKKHIPVPLEYIELKNKRQNLFIVAYKKWLFEC